MFPAFSYLPTLLSPCFHFFCSPLLFRFLVLFCMLSTFSSPLFSCPALPSPTRTHTHTHYRQHTTQHNTRFSPVFRTWCSSDTLKHERGTTPLPSAGPDPLHSKWRAVWELTKAHALWRCVALRVAVAAAAACWMRVAVAFRCRLVCFVCALPSPPGGVRVCQVHVGDDNSIRIGRCVGAVGIYFDDTSISRKVQAIVNVHRFPILKLSNRINKIRWLLLVNQLCK